MNKNSEQHDTYMMSFIGYFTDLVYPQILFSTLMKTKQIILMRNK